MDDALPRFREAFERWLWAIYYRGKLPTTEWAVAPDALVIRHVASEPPEPPQRIEGVELINEWLQNGPVSPMSFALVPGTLAVRSETAEDGSARLVGEVRYEVTVDNWAWYESGWVSDPFHNRGTWRATLAPDGRIATLEHVPDPLKVEELPASLRR